MLDGKIIINEFRSNAAFGLDCISVAQGRHQWHPAPAVQMVQMALSFIEIRRQTVIEVSNFLSGFGGKRKVTFSGYRGGHICHFNLLEPEFYI